MTLVVPNTGELEFLKKTIQTQNVTLKLYSNDVTPSESDTASSYTEVAGGGYAAKVLASVSWIFTGSDPSDASYPAQDFNFTGPTNAPGTIYGYFVVDSLGVLLWAERMPSSVLPFSPGAGTLVRVTPKMECS